ncbi:FAD-dependent oxidoreductase [Actinomycetospora sp. TBRC 11914]|uniref:FAD-dependent oxidoreductase n=1 Tax=Actinomycetospora sp. TBRC 11914 TaxID=2729387 RepID=UPI00145D7524|nr:FAD-dependent oxidoreductase [Actinomycetospora sp. TBRC 11914]NMO90797.1 FAD-dependent oxidoreductase [Actinomycetospora sp. TBRC 11914]
MRLVVDLTRCQGYAQCAFLAPDDFTMQGQGEALLYDPEPADERRERVLRAAAACPVQAIVLDRGPARNGDRAAVPAPRRGGSTGDFLRTGRIVVVGASLAGARAAGALRYKGFRGSLTVIGDEAHDPYDRPPLSKQVQEGRVDAGHTGLPRRRAIEADWRLGVAATGLDLAARQVRLADGSSVGFDRLLIATGVRARPWPDPDEAALEGVLVLRTREDADGLARLLAGRPRRVLVIGAGFTGSEVASVCRTLDIPVTVAEAGAAPLVAALGGTIGAIAAEVQRDAGVDLRCGVRVSALEGEGGRLRRARLSDGSTLDVDVAVAALGGIRNVEWLEGSGLASGPWGVACDAGCRALDANGLVTDDVFVAGDVARAPQPAFGYQFLALEHWGNAVAQAEVAAHNMLSDQAHRWPHLEVPVFWSTQFGHEIKSVGVPNIADEVVVTQGSVPDRRFVAAYGRRGRLVGAVTVDHSTWLDFYKGQIERAAPFPPRWRTVDQPAALEPEPAGFPTHPSPTQDATVVLTGHDPDERRATLLPP